MFSTNVKNPLKGSMSAKEFPKMMPVGVMNPVNSMVSAGLILPSGNVWLPETNSCHGNSAMVVPDTKNQIRISLKARNNRPAMPIGVSSKISHGEIAHVTLDPSVFFLKICAQGIRELVLMSNPLGTPFSYTNPKCSLDLMLFSPRVEIEFLWEDGRYGIFTRNLESIDGTKKGN